MNEATLHDIEREMWIRERNSGKLGVSGKALKDMTYEELEKTFEKKKHTDLLEFMYDE